MIKYRLAMNSDTAALVELMEVSALTLQRDVYSQEQIRGALGTVFGVDSQLIDDGSYFVVENDERIVACGGWSRRQTLFGGDAGKKSRVDPLLDPVIDAARIRAFFVHPDFVRRGIGMELIRRCEQAGGQFGFKRMELVATLTGEKLYARAGYKPVEYFDIALANGEKMPAVSMVKNLL